LTGSILFSLPIIGHGCMKFLWNLGERKRCAVFASDVLLHLETGIDQPARGRLTRSDPRGCVVFFDSPLGAFTLAE
jgi:hypothetical protein